jgi:hypothetical protein
MSYTILEPEVAGGAGPRTIATRSVHPPNVSRLHYLFDGWLGDDLLETFPCFIVSERVAMALIQAACSGITLAEVEISTSSTYDELHPHLILPHFRWLKVEGVAGHDDLGIAPDHRLVASPKALKVFETFSLAHADRSPYIP